MIEIDTESESISVGTILRESREERNISITDVAHQLHLDSRIIRALEEDDYDYLPDPIYVRGYIRNYCKLLEKEPEVILDQFMKNSGGKDPEIIPEIKHPSQTSSSDKPVKAFTYLISLALVILLIAWWQSNFIIDNDSTPVPEETTDDDAVPSSLENDEYPIEESFIDEVDTLQVTTPEFEDDTFSPDESTQDETDFMEQISEAGDEQPFLQTDDELSSDVIEDEVLEDNTSYTSTPTVSTDNTVATTALDSEPEVYVASTGPDTLVLTVNADSWIEIYDVNLQRVYFDLGRRGDRLTLYGTAPFEILLGFAQGVSIEFNGEPIEQAPYTRSGVARFTLGE